jgi:Integrase core domain
LAGQALDNAVCEVFHSTLEFELLATDALFATRAQARQAVAGYLDYCNHQRRHSTCGMLAPAAHLRPAQNRGQFSAA